MRVDLNQEEWDAWMAHPVTQAYRQYLRDLADQWGRLWVQGAIPPERWTPEQARAECLGDQGRISWQEIASFYRGDE